MAYLFSNLLNWLRGLFFQKHLEVTIVGLQASGKTSLVNVLAANQFSEDVVPTVAFNLRQVKKGNVVMKVWDVAGQAKFRNMWDRYSRGADALVYVVDAADLANKNDLPGALGVDDLIAAMSLDKIQNRPVSCYSTSNKTKHNLDIVLAWLSQRAH